MTGNSFDVLNDNKGAPEVETSRRVNCAHVHDQDSRITSGFFSTRRFPNLQIFTQILTIPMTVISNIKRKTSSVNIFPIVLYIRRSVPCTLGPNQPPN